jgi:hypothetical protein
MSVGEEYRGRRAAENQSIFREINERVEEINDGFGIVLPMHDWVCECDDVHCTERLTMTVAGYEAVRAHSRRFAVLPGHVVPEIEGVVATSRRFVVVEKIGAAGAHAQEHDPRSNGAS